MMELELVGLFSLLSSIELKFKADLNGFNSLSNNNNNNNNIIIIILYLMRVTQLVTLIFPVALKSDRVMFGFFSPALLAQSVATQSVNPGVVSLNPSLANIFPTFDKSN